jgi:small subunit ribosomal protein S17
VSDQETQEPTTQPKATAEMATPADATTEMAKLETGKPEAATRAKATTSAEASSDRTRRKVRTGVVVSEKMDKTVLVRIDRKVRHPLYKKTLKRSNKLAAHDENNDARVGDTVRVMETRPISKTKRWRIVEVVERAK